MQYIFSEEAGLESLVINGDLYKYLVKVRRFKEGDEVSFRNLKDDCLYNYFIKNISRKELFLTKKEKIFKKNPLEKELEIFWCVIDPKTIEKTLPFLNQIGVKKITFVYCDRSQKNFRLDFEKFKKIVINSNQQSGRVHIMEFELKKSLKEIIENHKDLAVLDFGGSERFDGIKKVLIGCEGGFTEVEKILMKDHLKIAFSTKNILKSETAAVAISSKLLI